MISVDRLKRRIFRTVCLVDLCFGLLLLSTAYIYFILRINAQIYIGEHILHHDSQQGQIVQAITGLVVSLIAERYGRAAAALCRQLFHLILTVASIRYGPAAPVRHHAQAGSTNGPNPEFELAVSLNERR